MQKPLLSALAKYPLNVYLGAPVELLPPFLTPPACATSFLARRVLLLALSLVQTSFPRVRKMDNPFMVSALYLLDFFEAKYLAWSSSIFDELHRKVGPALAVESDPAAVLDSPNLSSSGGWVGGWVCVWSNPGSVWLLPSLSFGLPCFISLSLSLLVRGGDVTPPDATVQRSECRSSCFFFFSFCFFDRLIGRVS